jgi:hypothetical protein
VRAALALVAACASAPPAATPPTNQAGAAPRGATSHFVLIASPFYTTCGQVHRIQVLVDGALRATVASSTECPGPMHQVPGKQVWVSDADMGHVDRSTPFEIAAGHHRIEVRDVEGKIANAIERDFPMYDDKHRLMEQMAAKLEDAQLTILGVAYEFIVSPITE